MVKKQIQMKYIVTFFFCLLLLTECFARPITLQDIPEEQLQLLFQCDDMVRSTFKLKKRNRKQKALHFRYASKPSITMTGKTVYVQLVKKDSLLADPYNCQTLFSALLLSSGALALNDGAEHALPLWLCAGFVEKINAYQKAERYLHGLNVIPVAEAMYAQNFSPDLKNLPDLPPPVSQEAWNWYCQYARLLLEEAIDRKLLPAYGARILQTANYNKENVSLHKQLFFSSGKPRVIPTEKILWNIYHPEPADLKYNQLEKILQWELPELDKTGKPTGKSQKISLLTLHDHLQNRPDAAEQRKAAAVSIQKFRYGCSTQEVKILENLYFLLYNFPRDLPETTAQLEKNISLLKETLKNRTALENFLLEAELKNAAVFQIFSRSLNVSSSSESATAEQLRFLEETEKNYGD